MKLPSIPSPLEAWLWASLSWPVSMTVFVAAIALNVARVDTGLVLTLISIAMNLTATVHNWRTYDDG